MAALVLLLASIVVLLGTTVGLVWRVRDPNWVRDTGLAQNATPRSTVVTFVLAALFVGAAALIGVVLLTGGHVLAGLAFLVAAASGGVMTGVGVWVFRQRLTGSPGADDDDPDA